MRTSARAASIGLLFFALACATPTPSDAPIDWRRIDEPWSLHVVTIDEDGDERVTRIWLALVDGRGALRTGDSRWWQNLQRDPALRIRVDGVDHPVVAEFVDDRETRARIDDAFVAKYGWLERLMFPQDRGETHEHYARLRKAN